MQKLKPYKTVEQIAKKHRLEVSFIQKQLDMGEPIEHEHTKDHKLATEIALQHLDEIPDYYTRLKKMETSAKKEHKKFKDVTEGKRGLWDNIHARRKAGKPRKKPGEKGYPKTLDIPEQVEMQRYCPRCQKNESRDACKYGPKYWDMFSTPITLSSHAYDPNRPHPANEEKDHEYSMARSEISTIISAAKRLRNKMGKGEGSLEAWVQSKITKAADYLDSAADYVDSGEMKAEGVSFDISPRHKELRTTNASRKLQKMTTAQQAQLPKEKVKKVLGTDLPRIKKESVSIEDANGNHYAEFIDIIKPEPLKPSEGIGSRMLGIEEGLKQARKNVGASKCWPGKVARGTKMKNGREVPNCVPEGKTFDDFMEAVDKSKMKCNSPKSDPVGDSLTGKSHVVKACSDGKEKIIRFGQRGVKGSPKKKGESKEYASRRHRFQTRHAKNIAKGPMSAAYWANKVKW